MVEPIWKRTGGEEIPVSSMQVHHVRNALLVLQRDPSHEQKYLQPVLEKRLKELEQRG